MPLLSELTCKMLIVINLVIKGASLKPLDARTLALHLKQLDLPFFARELIETVSKLSYVQVFFFVLLNLLSALIVNGSDHFFHLPQILKLEPDDFKAVLRIIPTDGPPLLCHCLSSLFLCAVFLKSSCALFPRLMANFLLTVTFACV